MSIPSLLPIGGAALGVLASRAIGELSQGLSFRQLLMAPQHDSASNNGEIDREKAQSNLNEQLPQFARRLHDRLKSAGISISHPFTLRNDGFGSLVVDGDHPDRAAIEEIFSRDRELAEEFQAIAAAATEWRDHDPNAATGSRFGEFRLDFADGAAVIRFE